MDIQISDDWYSELESNVNKLFQAKNIYLNCFDEPESWECFSIKFIDSFEDSQFINWEVLLDGFTNHIMRVELGFEDFDTGYLRKQAGRLLKLLTNFSEFSITTNSYKIDLSFQKRSSQKCNLVWLLIIISYLLKVNGHQDDFYKFACSFNDLVKNLKIGVNNQPEPDPEVQVNQPPEGTIKAKATETKPKKCYSTTNQADTLILILAQKYLSQLQEIGQKKQLESNDIDSVLKNYEWVWHGDANKKPNSFETDIKGNLCWIEIVFNKSKKTISDRISFNDLMKAIKNDDTFVQSLRVGEPFQMNGSGLTEKGFKKI